MRILLIDPPFKRFTGYVNNFFPIGLATLAAVLSQKGFEVKIMDVDALAKGSDINFSDEYRRLQLYVEGINDRQHPAWDDIRQVVADFNPEIIGITVMTQKFGAAVSVARTCKEVKPAVPIIAGGPHPTIDAEQVLQEESFDFVVRGEGEYAFLDLACALKSNGATEGITGLSFKRNGLIVHNPAREFVKDLDAIPFPDRDKLMSVEKYSSEDMGVIMSSRGCPFRCTYCFHMWNRRVRFRSAENVVDEIQLVKEKYGTQQFAFKDDTFTVNRKRLEELCDLLIKRQLGVNWECTTRVDVLDEERLKKMILLKLSILAN